MDAWLWRTPLDQDVPGIGQQHHQHMRQRRRVSLKHRLFVTLDLQPDLVAREAPLEKLHHLTDDLGRRKRRLHRISTQEAGKSINRVGHVPYDIMTAIERPLLLRGL